MAVEQEQPPAGGAAAPGRGSAGGAGLGGLWDWVRVAGLGRSSVIGRAPTSAAGSRYLVRTARIMALRSGRDLRAARDGGAR